jgi:hypothetical protein
MELSDVAPEREQISAALARDVLEKERQERQAACAREIQEILERHNCQLAGAFIWQNGQGQVQIQVVAQ